MALSAELILKMLAARCATLPLGVEAEVECRCGSPAQKKARPTSTSLGGEHEALRDAKPEHCLPKAERRQSHCLFALALRKFELSGATHIGFDVDQMRRFAKALSCDVGRSSALALYPATSQEPLGLRRSKSAKDRSQYANDQTAI
jgi:hypothetical protein